MGRSAGSTFLWAAAAVLAVVGCEHKDWDPPPPPATRPVRTVASLVPAATDLIVGMGAGDRLVAVSTYDSKRPDVGSEPKAGDYQTTDWELLAKLRPSVLVTDKDAGHRPAGFDQRAAALGIEVVRVHVDHLSDIPPAIDALGAALDAKNLAIAANGQLSGQLNTVRRLAAAEPPVAALIVTGPHADSVAGPGEYLDELLALAGGTNVAAPLGKPYPTVDRETMASLQPAVIFQLVPGQTPQQAAGTAAEWKQFPSIPAVAAGRVVTVTDQWAELPGWHVGDLAERFGRALHPNAMSGLTVLTTRPTP